MVEDLQDELALSGSKRKRQIDDEQTSVKVSFKRLSSKSKKKLEELLHQWSEWHAQECSPSEGSDEDLDCGEKTYFPALNVGADKSSTICVYMDSQAKKKQRMDDSQLNQGSVPVYDRDFEFALTSGNEVANNESGLDILNTSRCLNCDAYDHSLKECPKPINKVAVNNARKMYQLKNKRPSGPRVLTRYYQDTPGGKFDGLKPGSLDLETRKLLGLGEFDPPVWLNRMRELGYPPGYLELKDEDQPSGIIIHANGDTKEENGQCVNTISTKPKTKMTVDFPGINAPVPVNANQNSWATPNMKPGINTSMPVIANKNRLVTPNMKPGINAPISVNANQSSWATPNMKPGIYAPISVDANQSSWATPNMKPGINTPISANANHNSWATSNFTSTGYNSHSFNKPLNHRVESSSELCYRGNPHNTSWRPDCRREFRPLMSDHAHSYKNNPSGLPLLSSYANQYLDRDNQRSTHYSSYAYQNTWSSSHG